MYASILQTRFRYQEIVAQNKLVFVLLEILLQIKTKNLKLIMLHNILSHMEY